MTVWDEAVLALADGSVVLGLTVGVGTTGAGLAGVCWGQALVVGADQRVAVATVLAVLAVVILYSKSDENVSVTGNWIKEDNEII